MDNLAPLFDKYSGALSLEQISTGISECIDNALDLFGDAMLLYDHKRYARASSLLLTSLQEAGKVALLQQMGLLSSREQKQWSRLWKHFRNHSEKDALGQSAKIARDAEENPGEFFWQHLVYSRTIAPAKEKIRQFGQYVDFIKKDDKWWSPREVTSGIVDLVIDDVVAVLYKLYRAREIGLFSAPALLVYRKEFAAFRPAIEFGKEYEIEDFGVRFFGLNGPYKRAWQKLIDQGILKNVPEDLFIMGKPWREWLMVREGEDLPKKSVDSDNR